MSVAAPAWSEIPELLPLRMHDFTRFAWVSDRARATWEPRVREITQMLFEIEWRAIVAGLRRCALRTVAADESEGVARHMGEHGLVVRPLEGIVLKSGYTASLEPFAGGSPTAYWCALGREPDVDEISDAYHANDQRTIGRLLGYPECCIEFFRRIWVEAAMVDTTWPMAVGTDAAVRRGDAEIDVAEPSLCGMQLRWLGARAVFHLPCSFRCEPSLETAASHLELAERSGFEVQAGWLREMLRWPVEWSALHGIAEIRSPVVKIVTRTDATPGKYVVRHLGDPASLPPETGAGLAFPFRRPEIPTLTQSRGFRLGLANPIEPVPRENDYVHAPWYAQDNGFATRYAMDRSHAPIVDAARRLLLDHPVGDGSGEVVDLGCGNGALVRKIVALCPGLKPGGVDRDAEKTAHARLLNPDSHDRAFRVADLFDDGAFDDGPFNESERRHLAVLMLGRLTEVPGEVASAFLERLRRAARHLLVYAYDDYIAQYGSLSEMAERVGLELLDGAGPTVRRARVKGDSEIVEPRGGEAEPWV